MIVLFVVTFLVIAGYVYERIDRRRDARLDPAPGRIVSVGEHQLHILCKGTGGPTVVIEQGAGELSRFWWPLQDDIAKFAQVCTYDRAGFGWSQAARGARTIQDRADELRALLLKAGIEGPYLFVAHSYGGLIVRSYFRQYPSEVAGMILVDTPEESSIFQPQVLAFYAKVRTVNRLFAIAATFGILRLLRHWFPLERYGFWLTGADEYSALCDDVASILHTPQSRRHSPLPGSFGSLPLLVITHGLPFPGPFAVLETNWSEGQKILAALSTNSTLIVAENSNHMIQHDQPALVLDAIQRMHAAITS